MRISKKQINRMIKTARDILNCNDNPVIYRVGNNVDVGTANITSNADAEIVVNTETLKKYLDPNVYDQEKAIGSIYIYLKYRT